MFSLQSLMNMFRKTNTSEPWKYTRRNGTGKSNSKSNPKRRFDKFLDYSNHEYRNLSKNQRKSYRKLMASPIFKKRLYQQ